MFFVIFSSLHRCRFITFSNKSPPTFYSYALTLRARCDAVCVVRRRTRRLSSRPHHRQSRPPPKWTWSPAGQARWPPPPRAQQQVTRSRTSTSGAGRRPNSRTAAESRRGSRRPPTTPSSTPRPQRRRRRSLAAATRAALASTRCSMPRSQPPSPITPTSHVSNVVRRWQIFDHSTARFSPCLFLSFFDIDEHLLLWVASVDGQLHPLVVRHCSSSCAILVSCRLLAKQTLSLCLSFIDETGLNRSSRTPVRTVSSQYARSEFEFSSVQFYVL